MTEVNNSLEMDATIENEKDTLGGTGILDSGLYPSKVTLAYKIVAQSGAQGLVLHAETSLGQEIRSTLWMTSGKAKGGTNYFTNKKGEKQYLPGFLAAQSLATLTVNKTIADLARNTEEKVVELYNFDAKKAIPTKVDMLMPLIGQDILIGLIRQTKDKQKKADDGTYVNTGETRDENEIDKFFRASDRMTTSEVAAGETEATFVDTWAKKWTGVTKDKTSKDTGKPGVPGAKPKSPNSTKPTASLFEPD